MNELIHFLSRVHIEWVYLAIFLFAYIENLFPPSPSDLLIVFGGALAAMDKGNVIFAILVATVGSTLGFMTMFIIGSWLGSTVIERKQFKHFPKESLHKVEGWFARYGYWIIIANRFLAGTRAVVSFFAGLSQLDFLKTTLLSLVSSLLWYSILVLGGFFLGRKWGHFIGYLETYSAIISGIMIVAAAGALIRYLYHRRTVKQ